MSDMGIWGRNNAVARSVNPPAELKTFVVRTERSIEATDLVKDGGSHQKTCATTGKNISDTVVLSLVNFSIEDKRNAPSRGCGMDSNFCKSPIRAENLWSYGGNRCPRLGSCKLFLQAGICRKTIIMEDPQPIARGHYLRGRMVFGGLREGITDVARTPN